MSEGGIVTVGGKPIVEARSGRPGGLVVSLGLLLLVAVLGVFGTAVEFDFLHWDDDRIIAALLGRGDTLSLRLSWAMRTDVTNLLTPVALLFWGALADMFGITATPFHVAGLLLHALNALLVYRLCLILLAWHSSRSADFSGWSNDQAVAAFLAAGLWAMHPLRAEVAVWAAAQPYALATAAGLLALLTFLHDPPATGYVRPPAYVASLILFAIAVFSHPHAMALCVVFPAVHYMRARSAIAAGATAFKTRHLLGYLPFFGIAAWSATHAATARFVQSSMQFVWGAQNFDPSRLLLEITKVVGFAGDFSIFHAWLPLHLTLVYDRYTLASWASPTFLASLAGLAATIALAGFRWRRGKPGLALLIVCHLAFCLPAAGLFVENFRAADRYVYATSIVAAVALAFGIIAAMEGGLRRVWQVNGTPCGATALALLALGFAMSSTVGEVRVWRETSTLMAHVAKTSEDEEFRVYGRVLESAYWVNRGEIVEARRALLALVEPPRSVDTNGERTRSMMFAFRFLARTGNCDQLRFVSSQVRHELRTEQLAEIDRLLASCG